MQRDKYIFVDGRWIPDRSDHLGETFFEKLQAAFTDPDKRFEFPIKPFEMDLTRSSKNAIYIGATILTIGLIGAAVILSNKNEKK